MHILVFCLLPSCSWIIHIYLFALNIGMLIHRHLKNLNLHIASLMNSWAVLCWACVLFLWCSGLYLLTNVFTARVHDRQIPYTTTTTTNNNLIEIFAVLVLEVSEAKREKEQVIQLCSQWLCVRMWFLKWPWTLKMYEESNDTKLLFNMYSVNS